LLAVQVVVSVMLVAVVQAVIDPPYQENHPAAEHLLKYHCRLLRVLPTR